MSLDKMVGNEIFLQGKYLDIGLNSSGTLGTRATAPTGFVTDAANGYIRLGMVGDTDGFGTGAAATRDAMLAGMPVESFTLGYDLGTKRYTSTNSERAGTTELSGGVTSDLSSGGVARAGWIGKTDEGVRVSQVMALNGDAKYMKVEVTLTNATASDIANLRYMRTIDADHGSTFDTINKVVEQGGNGSDGALVAAYTTAGKTPLFYYTQDDRAVVSSYGFDNQDPYAAGVLANAQAEGFSQKGDIAININFGLGTLAAGKSITITYYMGITDDLTATVKEINASDGHTSPTPDPTPINVGPVAVADTAKTVGTTSIAGNVLANDTDVNGDKLSATLVKGCANGTLSLNADGSFVYKAKAGFSGTDSFTYAASDGNNSATAKMTITVEAPTKAPVSDPIYHGVLGRALVQDASDPAYSTLTATGGRDTFYFNIGKDSGTDIINGFGHTDVVATSKAIYDGNGDGKIGFLTGNGFSLDGPGGTDLALISDVKMLRYMGKDVDGTFVYADAAVRPKIQAESRIGDDVMKGGTTDNKSQTFFFDTALGLDLGHDTLQNFGKKDIVVTTTALATDSTGHVALSSGGKLDFGTIDGTDLGDVAISGVKNAAISALEFDGAVNHVGSTYYIYSIHGSSLSTASLGF